MRNHLYKGRKPIFVTFMLALALVLAITITGCSSKEKGTITIGAKRITESEILANAIKLLIEKETEITVNLKSGLNNTLIWEAIQNGDIDGYVEYTGSGLFNILKQPTEYNPDVVYDKVSKAFKEEFKISWLKPLGFNNTYTLAVRKEDAQRLGLTNTSDLAGKTDNLIFGSTDDFIEREDGLPLVNKTYGLKFNELKTLDISLKIPALVDKSVDVIDAFSTDPQIEAKNLVALADDKQVFVPYYAAPILRDDTLAKYPKIEEIINKLAGKINDAKIRELNGKVELEHEDPVNVAKAWLEAEGLL